MNPDLIAQLIELLGRPEAEVMAEIDEYAARFPQLAGKLADLKSFLHLLYATLPGRTLEAVAEAMSLFKTGSGPIKPDLGDTA